MNGLATIRRQNDTAQDGVANHKANAREWLRRANSALDNGDYELFRNLTVRAAQEVEHLIPTNAR